MKRIGLFVGIDKYQNGISQLHCAVNDATQLSYSFVRTGFQVESIYNDQCDNNTIIKKIRALVKDLGKNDIFVFYFSGHGREYNGLHYLACINSCPEAENYDIDSISIARLVSLTNIPGLKRFFILDCCRSNILATRDNIYKCQNTRDIALSAVVLQNKNPEIIPPLILNSCSTGQQSFENLKENHGYFTKTLISVIENKKINSFRKFANSLDVVGTPRIQTVSWNGNLKLWDDVPLLDHWKKQELSVEAEKYLFKEKNKKIERFLVQGKIEISSQIKKEIKEYFNASKVAESKDDYAAALDLLNKALFILDTEKTRLAAEKRRQKNAEKRLVAEKERQDAEKRLAAEKERQEKRRQKNAEKRLAVEKERQDAEKRLAVEKRRIENEIRQELERKILFSVGKILLKDGVILEMVQIPPGTFMMGSRANSYEENSWSWLIGEKVIEGEFGRSEDEAQHEVTIGKTFWIGKFPVTQNEYEAVIGENPSSFKNGDYPVEHVNWSDAKAFCQKLNRTYKKYLPVDYQFDLPTEAQWEYACRAGTSTALNNGTNLISDICPNLHKVGWYRNNSNNTPHPVGQKNANFWGLYDMHGNIWEWCRDWYGKYPLQKVIDPTGPAVGAAKIIRGGCWFNLAKDCRSANRIGINPTYRNRYMGFRIALVPVE